MLIGSQKYLDKSFISAGVQVKVQENVINLVSQHPAPHDKHHDDDLNNRVEDNT